MVVKAFILKNNTVKLICPKCNAIKIEKVTEYINTVEAVKLEHKCRCGFLHRVLLERRQRHRKTVNLSGQYDSSPSTNQLTRGAMTVKDISRVGLNFQLNEDKKPDFVVGDKLLLTFHLDDNQKTLIRKEVVVKNILGPCVGVAFSSVDLYDMALGLYMFI